MNEETGKHYQAPEAATRQEFKKQIAIAPIILCIVTSCIYIPVYVMPVLFSSYAEWLWQYFTNHPFLMISGYLLIDGLCFSTAIVSLFAVIRGYTASVPLLLSIAAMIWIYLPQGDLVEFNSEAEATGIEGDFPIWVAPAD